MQKLRIIYQDPYFVAVDKPAGIMVHQPEDQSLRRFTANQPTVLRLLREQLGQYVYPVHRLDSATSGVLLMALDSTTAAKLQGLFQAQEVTKTYLALVRGFTDLIGRVDSPLSIDDEGDVMQEALTEYETLHHFELPIPVGLHSTSRFSLVKVNPKTGRFHQIRRHFKRVSHPLIGDTIHGDGKQNRIWRELTADSLLYLKAYSLSILHPETKELMRFTSRWNHAWQKVFDRAGFCPYL
jgi:tRNA pseudouridine65 synthase